jgi:hypothetical protein
MPHCSITIGRAYPHLVIIERDNSPDRRWRKTMKTMILAAVAVLSLGAGAAYASGGPVGFADGSGYQGPTYDAQASANRGNQAEVQFLGPNTVVGKWFHYSNSNQGAATPSTRG